MNTPVRIYLNIFILFFGAFLLGSYIFDLISGDSYDWLESASVALGIGFFISGIIGSMQVRALKKVTSDNINLDRYKLKHSNTIKLTTHEGDVIYFLKDRLSKKRWSLLQESESEGETVLKFRSPINWKSWGEIIYIRLFTGWHSSLNIEITSIPILSTTMIDYGKNKNNVDLISKIIKANFSVDDNEL
jgi:hypothetical protein